MDRPDLLAGLALSAIWVVFWLTPLHRLVAPRHVVQAVAALGMGVLLADTLVGTPGGRHG